MHLDADRVAGNKASRELTRIEGVDIARAFASLIMVQGHAYDAYASPSAKLTWSYYVTRVLGTLPLPSFYLLAGAALCLRVLAAAQKGEAVSSVRRALMRRGLQVMFFGYAFQILMGVVDGYSRPHDFLRADVLQAMGACLVLLGLVAPVPQGRAPTSYLITVGFIGAVVLLLVCPFVAGRLVDAPLALRLLLAPLVPTGTDVSLMSVVPLGTWAFSGLAIGALWNAMNNPRHSSGAPTKVLLITTGLGFGLAYFGALAVQWFVTRGTPLAQSNVTVVFNAVELLGRSMILLGLAALSTLLWPPRIRRGLVLVGQASLWVYLFHIPLSYGWFASPIRGVCSMQQATVYVVVLEMLCVLVALGRHRWLSRQKAAE